MLSFLGLTTDLQQSREGARMSSRLQLSQPELQTKREKVIKLLEESKTLQQAEAEIRVCSALTLLASIPTSIGALKAAVLAPG